MQTIFIFIFGFLMGGILSALLYHRKRVYGTIRVDTSDPLDGPYLFLELKEDLNSVANSRRVTFDVKVENFISQK